MATKDKRIDAYIAKSADFAKPILNHLRELIHKTCPEVEETMKWSFPHFDYKGQMMCSMAAFKQHAMLNFWKASLIKDLALQNTNKGEAALGHWGRITSLKELPSDKKIASWIKQAMKLNEEGKKVAKAKPVINKEISIPDYFTSALKKNKKAYITFEAFSPSCKREYVEWVTEAKREETRNKRLAQAIEMMAEGKKRNWKYER
jgi:uncharacterized protein YdeI (YjbR/CyaY-like superfamily)